MASAARPDATNAKTTLVHGIRGEAGCNQLHTYSAHSAYILRSLSAPPRRGWGNAEDLVCFREAAASFVLFDDDDDVCCSDTYARAKSYSS